MPVIYRPPLANPTGVGLYAAATLIDYDQSRLFEGVLVETRNCGPSWVWPIGCAPTAPDPSPKGDGDREPADEFTGDVIGAHDDCGLPVPELEATERAQQLLRLKEQVHVEQQLVPKLLAAAGAPTPVAGFVAALGALEQAVSAFGFPGVIHAAPKYAALAQSHHVVNAQGTQQVSPMRHRWAFGPGYAGLGETLIATGPVAVHRGPAVMVHGPDVRHNDRLSVAEREAVVSWECWAAAVTIGA